MNSFCITVNIEIATGKGEDAHLFSADDYPDVIVIGVFDGLGGRSAGYDGQTGGKIASQKASETVGAFLDQWYGQLNAEIVKALKEKVYNTLKEAADAHIKPSRLGGSLAGKRLCTTMALASIPKSIEGSTKYHVSLAWIGDSRLYFLSPEAGLQQLTHDDLEVKKDAFEMIREDPPMSQYLSADMKDDWQIHFKLQELDKPGCILACTDGCFQYLPAPWEFEKLLLNTLNQSENVKQWEDSLNQQYQDIKQDDVSLILYPIGYEDFENLKQSYKDRQAYLQDNFDCKNTNIGALNPLWEKYRETYEQYLYSVEKLELAQSSVEINRDSVPTQEIISEPSYENDSTIDHGGQELIEDHNKYESDQVEYNLIKSYLILAQIYLENNDFQEAIKKFLENLYPLLKPENLNSLGQENIQKIQDLELLLEQCLQSGSNKEYLDSDLRTSFKFFIAWINYLCNNLDKARDYCKEASQYYQLRVSPTANDNEKYKKTLELLQKIDNLTQISEGEN
ncbi:PP2C family protein-serine/threonine phosphatase [Planktothrix mougeotii]|uniref:Protein phosphatase 2C domain-containing protein n=1 Tax=Planktothrix mougeotii LEGE 06226 TaxID=1828728 RepID=A0ABR9U823_9CYAN|nr:protein phosphatase 2C domain-containing protein [Planktothrix mougeotii]MBE9142577.1 protein phosphatase 2C domain-containing protein [Planktothrix mougeotii LEGE 06226]